MMCFCPSSSMLQGSMLCASSSQKKQGCLEARCHNFKLVRNVTDICFMCLISHPGAVKDVCLSGKGSSHLWVEVLTSKLNTNKPPWEFVWNLHHLESLVPHFLRPRTTHLWCLQGSTAGSKLCSDSICAKGAAAMWCLLVLRIIWELSSWKLQFEHVNLSVRFDFLLLFIFFSGKSRAVCGSQTCKATLMSNKRYLNMSIPFNSQYLSVAVRQIDG